MTQEIERRQEPRAPIELKVEYRRLNTFFHDYTRNISRGGTFIRTKRPLDVGTTFSFKLVIPALPEPLSLRGEVRWVVREDDPTPADALAREPGMGIRFLYDTDEQRAIIHRQVEKLMIDSLGQLIYSRLMVREGGT